MFLISLWHSACICLVCGTSRPAAFQWTVCLPVMEHVADNTGTCKHSWCFSFESTCLVFNTVNTFRDKNKTELSSVPKKKGKYWSICACGNFAFKFHRKNRLEIPPPKATMRIRKECWLCLLVYLLAKTLDLSQWLQNQCIPASQWNSLLRAAAGKQGEAWGEKCCKNIRERNPPVLPFFLYCSHRKGARRKA